jgi:site-specific DNA-methyltransferase (adenine-specific)
MDHLNQFLLGDCFDIMPTIPAGSVDLVLADLPYNTTNAEWDRQPINLPALWAEYKRVLKSSGVVVLTASQPFTTLLISSNLKWFKYNVVWVKQRPSGHLDSWKKPLKAHEDILIFSKFQGTYNPQGLVKVEKKSRVINSGVLYNKANLTDYKQEFSNFPRTIIKFSIDTNHATRLHPTQKPVPLMEYLIKTYSNECEVVLDNTAGVATTAIAAINTNRHYIAIEKELKYWQLGTERIASHLECRQLKMELAG